MKEGKDGWMGYTMNGTLFLFFWNGHCNRMGVRWILCSCACYKSVHFSINGWLWICELCISIGDLFLRMTFQSAPDCCHLALTLQKSEDPDSMASPYIHTKVPPFVTLVGFSCNCRVCLEAKIQKLSAIPNPTKLSNTPHSPTNWPEVKRLISMPIFIPI